MTRQEYENKRAEMYKQIRELSDEYIRTNTDIEPGTTVISAGQKCYLHGYAVANGNIYPVLFKFNKDGTVNKNKKIYVSRNAKIVKV